MVLIQSNKAVIKRLLLFSIIQYSSFKLVFRVRLGLKACNQTFIRSTYINVGGTLDYSMSKYHADDHCHTFDEQETTASTN